MLRNLANGLGVGRYVFLSRSIFQLQNNIYFLYTNPLPHKPLKSHDPPQSNDNPQSSRIPSTHNYSFHTLTTDKPTPYYTGYVCFLLRTMASNSLKFRGSIKGQYCYTPGGCF